MNAQHALLEAICAAPDRDEPRLVYADWLEEREDPRGEWIQLQVAQARARPMSVEFKALQKRLDVLWAAGWAQWSPTVPAVAAGQWRFTRGFASALTTAPAVFVEQMDALFAAAPLLDDVQLECGGLSPLSLGAMGWLERMFSHRLFSRVKTLRLQSLNDAGAVVLSGLSSSLQSLELSRTNLGLGTYQVLGSKHSSLRNLTGLELMMANARDMAVEQLFSHPWPKLQTLAINNEVVGERGVRAITDGPKLPSLEQLDLSWSVLGAEGAMRAIADSRTLPRLRELDLSRCEVNDAMCEALATASGFQLKVLRLAHCRVGARGVRSLLESAATKHLEVLDLTGVALDAATQQLLGERGLA